MKNNSKIKQGMNELGQITRHNLERLGALLDTLHIKSVKTSKYHSVNLADLINSDKTHQEDLFRQQTIKASQQLMGKRFARYGTYAKKVMPDSMLQKAIDSSFIQIAKLASSWSEVEVPENYNKAGLNQLDEQQRQALANDIANQNRALATLGGVTGIAGLAGMLADSLWLLLISLRAVYQLAAVYNTPLTGSQGIKIAYDILAHADLSKMQEKQTLLAGLGVTKGLLDRAGQQGLRSELNNVTILDSNVQYYAKQVDKVAEHLNLDLDSINFSWINKLLPLSSVLVGMHYNNYLIDEVIGVAQATFGPEPKLTTKILEDNSVNKDNSPV
ncbi:EcsC family protein [Psychrobacter sp. I-STPA6b]|uniref:EcsC family protein n=1 Tax=Psychrobacter sp. I-STPA6b TaxID=2585718 RepID=UPI001D0C8FD7|nr:EcsC family protein [Psychrobacter sp. I-STPA6b]